MLDALSKVNPLGRLRDGDGDGDTVGREATPDEPVGNLYHCSSCDTAFIDGDMSTCSRCGNGVEEVRSSLRRS